MKLKASLIKTAAVLLLDMLGLTSSGQFYHSEAEKITLKLVLSKQAKIFSYFFFLTNIDAFLKSMVDEKYELIDGWIDFFLLVCFRHRGQMSQ